RVDRHRPAGRDPRYARPEYPQERANTTPAAHGHGSHAIVSAGRKNTNGAGWPHLDRFVRAEILGVASTARTGFFDRGRAGEGRTGTLHYRGGRTRRRAP